MQPMLILLQQLLQLVLQLLLQHQPQHQHQLQQAPQQAHLLHRFQLRVVVVAPVRTVVTATLGAITTVGNMVVLVNFM